MSLDDRTDDARMRERADGIDDGMIHEWLDGELDSVRAAELEALVASSPSFAARVAEERGLLAASSRILSALDEVPGNVLPRVAANEAAAMARPAALHASKSAAQPSARGWSARRWTGIAALLMVGVTGVVVARRDPEVTRARESVAIASDGAVDASAATEMALPVDSQSAVVSESLAASGLAVVDAARSQPAVAQIAVAPVPGAASSSRTHESVVSEMRSQVMRDERSSNAAPPTASAPVMQSAPTEVARRVAAVQSKTVAGTGAAAPAAERRERVAEVARGVTSAQGGVPVDPARLMLSADQSAPSDVFRAPSSDIASGELQLALQRVRCAPTCRQERIEIARDGRVRRWRQSLGSSSSPDTATVSERELTELVRTVSELRLDTLPTMLRLDGAQCRSVGSLRESLRVEFVHNDELRRVMGLPWCSDGTHIMDKAAAAIEAAADRALSRVSEASSRYW